MSPTRRTANEDGFPSAFSASLRETTQWLLRILASWGEDCGTQTFLTPRRRARRAKRITAPCLPRRACREIAFAFEARWWPQPPCGWFVRWDQTQGCPRSSANPRLGVSTLLALAKQGPNGVKGLPAPSAISASLREATPCLLRVRFQRMRAHRVCSPAGAGDPYRRGTHGSRRGLLSFGPPGLKRPGTRFASHYGSCANVA